MDLLEKILSRDEFADKPPVLLDIGASGSFHRKWKQFAKYSVCIAFDADERKMGYATRGSGGFKKTYVYGRIVTSEKTEGADFYLTRFPPCSSLLKPDSESLNAWAFADFFQVERKVRVSTTTIPDILQEIGLEKIDWFKTDSQGTDLRLFDSLGADRINRVLVAEFEPGIIDAYEGEDKLWSVMAYMEKRPFWMSDISIMGSQRIRRETVDDKLGPLGRKLIPSLCRISPGWGEVTYFNEFRGDSAHLDKRDYLLGGVFAVTEKQFGHAMDIAAEGLKRFHDPIFRELEDHALSKLRRGYFKSPLFIIEQLALKIFRHIHGNR
jgi:hypothetical protein